MITKADYKYFDKARDVASISDYKKIHVGCVAVYHGQIIGIGCNRDKTHPYQKGISKTVKKKGRSKINVLY